MGNEGASPRRWSDDTRTGRFPGGTCIALPADVSTVEGALALAEAYQAREPKLDILVNNAGAAWLAEFDQFPEKGWDNVMNLNVKAPFFLTQALHGALRAAAATDKPAKVVNIASIDGIYLTFQETYSYVASKAGLIQVTRLMAARLIKDGIVVSAIAPGPFKSDMNVLARDHEELVAARVPAKRVGRDEDMAAAAIYLASRAGDFVVGSTVTVDGGMAFATSGAAPLGGTAVARRPATPRAWARPPRVRRRPAPSRPRSVSRVTSSIKKSRTPTGGTSVARRKARSAVIRGLRVPDCARVGNLRRAH